MVVSCLYFLFFLNINGNLVILVTFVSVSGSESLLGHRHVQPYVVLDHDTFAGICLKFDMAASQFFVLNPQKHSVGGRVLLVPGEVMNPRFLV